MSVSLRPSVLLIPVCSVLWAFFYLVASSCVADWSFLVDSSWKASAAFGFISCLIYIVLVRHLVLSSDRVCQNVALCIPQSYWCWLAVRQGSDTVDNAYSGYSNLSHFSHQVVDMFVQCTTPPGVTRTASRASAPGRARTWWPRRAACPPSPSPRTRPRPGWSSWTDYVEFICGKSI